MSVEMANRCLPNETDLPLTGNRMLVGMDSSRRSLRYIYSLIVSLLDYYFTVYILDRIRRITSVPLTRTEVSTTGTIHATLH